MFKRRRLKDSNIDFNLYCEAADKNTIKNRILQEKKELDKKDNINFTTSVIMVIVGIIYIYITYRIFHYAYNTNHISGALALAILGYPIVSYAPIFLIFHLYAKIIKLSDNVAFVILILIALAMIIFVLVYIWIQEHSILTVVIYSFLYLAELSFLSYLWDNK